MAQAQVVQASSANARRKPRWPANRKERLVRDILLIGMTSGWAFVYMAWSKNRDLVTKQQGLPYGGNGWLIGGTVFATILGAALRTPTTETLGLLFDIAALGFLLGAIALLGANTEDVLVGQGHPRRIDYRYVLLVIGVTALLFIMDTVVPAIGLRILAVAALLTLVYVVALFSLDMDDARFGDAGNAPTQA